MFNQFYFGGLNKAKYKIMCFRVACKKKIGRVGRDFFFLHFFYEE